MNSRTAARSGELPAEERRRQIAAILARGVEHYLRRGRETQVSPTQTSSQVSPGGLEVSGETRLSVSE